MGFFNYFIKCVIRNITYKLCKPKVFLTVLLCVIILLFCFKNYGYCTSTSSESIVVNPSDSFTDSNGNVTGYIQYDNHFLTIQQKQIDMQREVIAQLYSMYGNNNNTVVNFVKALFDELKGGSSMNKSFYVQRAQTGKQWIINVYFQQELSADITNGAYVTSSGTLTYVNVPYQKGVFYEYYIYPDGTFLNTSVRIEKSLPVPFVGVFVSEWIDLFKDFGLVGVSDDNILYQIEEQNDLIAEQNYLQEQQNQQQKEQNDFLKQEATDDDVSVDSFNSVDSNDITSDGLTGVFNNIYNSITSWSSKNINLPIPYTNKNIVIPANYTENMLSSSGSSWIITFVHSIYYFIVARFIIYSITGIINSIKSGSILETDSKNNITTDML